MLSSACYDGTEATCTRDFLISRITYFTVFVGKNHSQTLDSRYRFAIEVSLTLQIDFVPQRSQIVVHPYLLSDKYKRPRAMMEPAGACSATSCKTRPIRLKYQAFYKVVGFFLVKVITQP